MDKRIGCLSIGIALLLACAIILCKYWKIDKEPEMPEKKESIEQVKSKHEMQLLKIDGVEGVGIGEEDKKQVIKIYVSKNTKEIQEMIPTQIAGYPVRIEVTGEFHALPR
jgi:hypothetical protein